MERSGAIDDAATGHGIGAFGRDHPFQLCRHPPVACPLFLGEVVITELVPLQDLQRLGEHRMDHKTVVVVEMEVGTVTIPSVTLVPLMTEAVHTIHQSVHVTLACKLQECRLDDGGEEQPVALIGFDAAGYFPLVDEPLLCLLVESSP